MIDLSHSIEENIPVFPGDPSPTVKQYNTIEVHEFNQKLICLVTHTATHIDAPAHVIKNAPSLDDFDLDYFLGSSVVINVKDKTVIDDKIILSKQNLIKQADFVIFNTGYHKYWTQPRYLNNYPVLSIEAAELLRTFKLKAIGLDTISPDKKDSLLIHKILLSHHILIIENLANLDLLPTEKLVNFFAIPLKIKNADGAPARCFASIENP